jgi:hypothetical protein
MKWRKTVVTHLTKHGGTSLEGLRKNSKTSMGILVSLPKFELGYAYV